MYASMLVLMLLLVYCVIVGVIPTIVGVALVVDMPVVVVGGCIAGVVYGIGFVWRWSSCCYHLHSCCDC